MDNFLEERKSLKEKALFSLKQNILEIVEKNKFKTLTYLKYTSNSFLLLLMHCNSLESSRLLEDATNIL